MRKRNTSCACNVADFFKEERIVMKSQNRCLEVRSEQRVATALLSVLVFCSVLFLKSLRLGPD